MFIFRCYSHLHASRLFCSILDHIKVSAEIIILRLLTYTLINLSVNMVKFQSCSFNWKIILGHKY